MAEWVVFDTACNDTCDLSSANFLSVSALDLILRRGILVSNGDLIYKGFSRASNIRRKKSKLFPPLLEEDFYWMDFFET